MVPFARPFARTNGPQKGGLYLLGPSLVAALLDEVFLTFLRGAMPYYPRHADHRISGESASFSHSLPRRRIPFRIAGHL